MSRTKVEVVLPVAAVIMFLLLSLCVELSMPAVTKDKIIDLPGLTFKPNFSSYSGYLKATGTKRLHYWLVTSQGDPTKDPLILWLNGGPGSSSFLGLLKEHGPYLINSDGVSLRLNAYSWNRVASVIYLEAPAGVGYSYSEDRNYTFNDEQVAVDNYLAMKNFFMLYPEFTSNDFYVTGESYGGIYVPTLSVKIIADKKINFKGLAIGNGLLDYRIRDNSIIDFAYGHGLIGTRLMHTLIRTCCKPNHIDCNFHDSPNVPCQKAVSEASIIVNSINIYNMYDECYPNPNTSLSSWLFAKNPFVQAERKRLLKVAYPKKLDRVPPCINDTAMITYMNIASVRKALHIPDDLPEWTAESSEVANKYVRQYQTVKPQILDILSTKKYMILIYNGDIDMACDFLGDEWFVDALNQPLVAARQEWMYTAADGTQQVAGFVKHFQNLVYATIRGSGHMVPEDKPIQAFDMFSKFVNNKRL